MIQWYHRRARAVLLSVLVCTPLSVASAAGFDRGLQQKLFQSAPGLDAEVLISALDASRCAIRNGLNRPERLAVIDFSLPSSAKRLWIFDLNSGELLLNDLVAHGKKSGADNATAFSNRNGSHQSSIGLFQANETYHGKHGYSLRLDGLEPGINDRARERAIVIHGADYVDPSWVATYGRIGRSLGCPAVSQQVITEVVDNLKGGQFVFSYYPDRDWLGSSSYLNCEVSQVAGSKVQAGNERI
ncbi:murein L,D-transpeptidase catalytic domain family protein [Marinobacter sp. X15-166B]|uniref:murein L,D-transpeptidase catalytic domain family protein n=1 Tax=Marinobacter sp. X15-166B TaxID=1897620 RepID=UPI00085C00A3|nr:murein L,D-transpeptidase catalytic domain family protein [Marinobacter sp. X15-166B]OEY65324.1 hypothetical protein BG841_01835 [Marinobacter sp. X15-166B]